jgi:rSAM/selenodomain-associated transferase 2
MQSLTRKPRLSVVIPALDAAGEIRATLAAVERGREAGLLREIVVVDGGSRDETAACAATCGARVVRAPRGRGGQLAAGAAAAEGDWLLFLHADTVLEADWVAAVARFIDGPGQDMRAGAFRLAFEDSSPGARRVAGLANWRARRLGLPYGDQGLLISRALYDAIGGYAAHPLMEDVDIVRRIGRARLALLDATARTSGVRYRRDGWWARPLRNLLCLALYFVGVPPRRLVPLYRGRHP